MAHELAHEKKNLAHKVIKHLLNVFKDNNRRKLCVFHKDYFTFYNQDWNSNSEINFGIICSNCSMKVLSDLVVKIGILEISNINL